MAVVAGTGNGNREVGSLWLGEEARRMVEGTGSKEMGNIRAFELVEPVGTAFLSFLVRV